MKKRVIAGLSGKVDSSVSFVRSSEKNSDLQSAIAENIRNKGLYRNKGL